MIREMIMEKIAEKIDQYPLLLMLIVCMYAPILFPLAILGLLRFRKHQMPLWRRIITLRVA